MQVAERAAIELATSERFAEEAESGQALGDDLLLLDDRKSGANFLLGFAVMSAIEEKISYHEAQLHDIQPSADLF